MTRGNQRDEARLKNQKKLAGKGEAKTGNTHHAREMRGSCAFGSGSVEAGGIEGAEPRCIVKAQHGVSAEATWVVDASEWWMLRLR
jgi:hypothetical protein